MFAAHRGISAVYSEEGDSRVRLVVAFTDHGEPMVIGDIESGHGQALVRADAYDGFLGMKADEFSPGSAVNANGVDYGRESSSKSIGPQEDLAEIAMEFSMTEWEVAAVSLVALRALELAGKRQLGNSSRNWRSHLRGVPSWEIHTLLPISETDKALQGAYDLIRIALPGRERTYSVIDKYVRERIKNRCSHDPRKLIVELSESGCFD